MRSPVTDRRFIRGTPIHKSSQITTILRSASAGNLPDTPRTPREHHSRRRRLRGRAGRSPLQIAGHLLHALGSRFPGGATPILTREMNLVTRDFPCVSDADGVSAADAGVLKLHVSLGHRKHASPRVGTRHAECVRHGVIFSRSAIAHALKDVRCDRQWLSPRRHRRESVRARRSTSA